MEQQVYVKHVVMEPTLVHGDGELYGKGELHEGKLDEQREAHEGELDEEREAHEGELDGEREVHEEGGPHEGELHGLEEVQDSEGGSKRKRKRELLHGRRKREGETETPSVICRILRDRLEGHFVVSIQLLQKADFASRG